MLDGIYDDSPWGTPHIADKTRAGGGGREEGRESAKKTERKDRRSVKDI